MDMDRRLMESGMGGLCMDGKELRELLMERLHIEIQLFKDSMYQRTKKEIFQASYEIEVFINIYEILLEFLEEAGEPDEGTVRGLSYWKYGILETLYQEWLGREDSFYDELCPYVGSEVRVIAQAYEDTKRKEG